MEEPEEAENERSPRDREELVRAHMWMVTVSVNKWARGKSANVWEGDLRGAASESLWKSSRSYDSSHGASFATYSRHRMNGAMIDEWRHLVTKRHEYKAPAYLVLEQFRQDDDSLKPPEGLIDRSTPETILLNDDRMALLLMKEMFDDMGKDGEMAGWYYIDHLTLLQIGKRIGRTEGRVSQRMRVINAEIRRRAKKMDLVD